VGASIGWSHVSPKKWIAASRQIYPGITFRAVGPGECLDATYRANRLLRLQRPPFLDARGQAGEIELRGPETRVACPVLDEPVRYAEVQNGQLQAVGRQHFADA
jgi:hypothetical protein